MRGTCSMHDRREKCLYNDLNKKSGRSRSELENNVKINLREAQDINQHGALVNTLMNILFA
jgi:hypothetical protein